MKRTHYNKLIRDRVPANMKRKGAAYKVKRLGVRQFKTELLKKVGEEASALPGLSSKKDIASELADTLDVIKEIQKTFRISSTEIKRAQKQAMAKKGGFRKRIYLVWSQDTGYKTNERKGRRS